MHDAPDLPLRAAARRLRRRALLAAWLGTFARHATAALLLGGAAILLLRFLGELDRERAALALLLSALAPLTAWLWARRRFLSDGGAGAWLDVRAGGSGLVVTGLETGDERWLARAVALVEDQRAPGVRTERVLAPVLPAALFAAVALWVDVPVAPPGPPAQLYQAHVEELQEKLRTLEEDVQLDEEVAEELGEQLDRLREEVDAGASPEAMFEALDSLEERLEDLAAEVAEQAEAAAESLEAARAEAAAEQPDLGEVAESLAEAMETLADAGLGGELSERMGDTLESLGLEGLDLPPGAELTAGEALELSAEMLEQLRELMEGLEAAGLLHEGQLRALTQEELERLLENLGELAQHECDEECAAGGT